MEFQKPPKTINEQISLLKSRGLVVLDESKLGRYLRNISYYHLSIYFKHFQKDDAFIEGTTFEDVLNIYVFDQKLRLLLLDVLERIEKSFKCRLAYEMSVSYGDSHWLSREEYFDDKRTHSDRIGKILDDLEFSKETCIRHYYEKYNSPKDPPIWMIIEAITFRQCAMIYGLLQKDNQRLVANTYGINKIFIYNWMYALSIIRNFCAHHSRLWNNEFIIRLNQRHGIYGKFFDNSNGNRLFNYLVVMQIINCKFNPDSKWMERLESIIGEHKINVSHMGFPNDWRDRMEKITEINTQD